jgi:hypothetical protein
LTSMPKTLKAAVRPEQRHARLATHRHLMMAAFARTPPHQPFRTGANSVR